MFNSEEKQTFLEQGFHVARGVLQGDHLKRVQDEFDRVWEQEGSPVNQTKLLKHPCFIELIEHAPILDLHKCIFGEQVQLLQYDFLRQGPRSDFAERSWHRDFSFPGDNPLSVNTILYLDDITDESGPTYVVPGSHRGSECPPTATRNEPQAGEVAVHAKAGDATLINSAIWHSGGRNRGAGLRRGIYLYYGYWFLKRYEATVDLPWQALENAGEQRLRLLGVKMPGHDIHQY